MSQGPDRRAKRAREAEVRQLELAVSADQKVLRLQVAAKQKNTRKGGITVAGGVSTVKDAH